MVRSNGFPDFDATVAHLVALAEEAVVAVLHDLHRATSLRPTVEVDQWMESSVRISINRGYTAPSMFAPAKPEAFAEVADYFQEQLDQSGAGAWPVCKEHNAGLHAEVRDETAVWRCRLGGHTVAAIGALDE